jgi:RHS repeat-associated protein
MAGISDKALKSQYAENKNRYNGGNELQNKEFDDGSGLEAYDAENRMYDPQIGRFWQIDPLADINESYSSYSFANDNPLLLNDPLGLTSDSSHPQELEAAYVTAAKKTTPSGPDVANAAGAAPTSVAALPINGASSVAKNNNAPVQDKGDHNLVTDIAYEINKFNPLAQVVNLGFTIFTKHDSYDQKQTTGQAVLNLAATIPVGGLSSTIANVGLTEVRQGIAKTLSIENDIVHILASKHNLSLLLPKAGSEANIIRRLYLSLGQTGGLPTSGFFQKVINIYGYDVTIRGAVVNGIPRISTAFIP